MATDESQFCTDEELLLELEKLGYSDVSADAFLMVKKNFSELVLKDRSIPKNSLKYQERYSHKNSKYSIPPRNVIQPSTYLPRRSPTFVVDSKIKNPLNYSPPSSYIPDISLKKYETTQNETLSDEEAADDDVSDTSKSSPDTSITNMSFNKYRERLKTFKAGRQSQSLGMENQDSSSSVSLEGNRIKRKVLRHKNGKPVITEEFIEIPSIFNTPDNLDLTPKSVFSSDVSLKTNSSSGSLSAASPETSSSPRSTDSLSSTRSVLSRISVPRKKKSDPVAMYNYYKKFWNEHKPPGEKKHDKLRWAVRDRMLEYSL